MTSKSPLEGINRTELTLTSEITNPDIDDELKQTFARLLGYDPDDKIWRLLKVNTSGQLLVSSGGSGNSSFRKTSIALLSLAVQILVPANPYRTGLVIETSGAPIMIVTTGDVLAPQLYKIPAFTAFEHNSYKGDVFVRNLLARGCVVNAIEEIQDAGL